MQTLDVVNYVNDNLILLKMALGLLAVMLVYLTWEKRKEPNKVNHRP